MSMLSSSPSSSSKKHESPLTGQGEEYGGSGVLVLNCQVQHYDWGKRGKYSTVAKIKTSGRIGACLVDANMPYAELWMGTHPSGPARISSSNEFLLDWLKDNPSAIGRVPKGYPAGDLPFLFKVLSINTALSIQAHPDKALAQELHAKYPNIYKDPNHKPEMAIALTPFEAMSGFRPVEEIKENLVRFPELRHIIGEDVCEQFLAFEGEKNNEYGFSVMLQVLFRRFMECDDDIAQYQVTQLVTRISEVRSPAPRTSRSRTTSTVSSSGSGGGDDTCTSFFSEETYVKSLIVRLNKDYPADRGALCPLLLNCLRLAEGEAFFMGPNEPHAYISGDCVESMALSDNVVRAGLTPKFRDVETLCSMLTYGYGPPRLLAPLQVDPYTLLYRPPPEFSEFEVEVCTLPPNSLPYHPVVLDCGSILLVFKGTTCTIAEAEGEEEPLPMGSVIFLAANKYVTITAGSDGACYYRAHVNMGELP